MAEIQIVKDKQTITMTAREFAGIVIGGDGKAEATTQPDIRHDIRGRSLVTRTQPDGMIVVAGGGEATIVDATSKKPLFTLKELEKEDTGKVRARLNEAKTAIIKTMLAAVAASDGKTLGELGFSEDETKLLLNPAKEKPAAAPEKNEPAAQGVAPGAPPIAARIPGTIAPEAEEAHRKAMQELRAKADKARPTENAPEETAASHNAFIESGGHLLAGQHVADQTRNAMTRAKKFMDNFLEKHPELVRKPEELAKGNPNLPPDRGITSDVLQDFGRMTPEQAKNDPRFGQLQSFLDRDGNKFVDALEIISGVTLTLGRAGVTFQDPAYDATLKGITNILQPGQTPNPPARDPNQKRP